MHKKRANISYSVCIHHKKAAAEKILVSMQDGRENIGSFYHRELKADDGKHYKFCKTENTN